MEVNKGIFTQPIPLEILQNPNWKTIEDIALRYNLDNNDLTRFFWVIFFDLTKSMQISIYDPNSSAKAQVVTKKEACAIKEEDPRVVAAAILNSAKESILRHIFKANPESIQKPYSLTLEIRNLSREFFSGYYWDTLLQDFPQLDSNYGGNVTVDTHQLMELIRIAFHSLLVKLTRSDKEFIKSLKEGMEP